MVLINGKIIIINFFILTRLLILSASFQISLLGSLVLASLAVAISSTFLPIASASTMKSLALVLLAVAWEQVSTIVPPLIIPTLLYHLLKCKATVSLIEPYFLISLCVGFIVAAEIACTVEARSLEFEALAVHVETSSALAFAASVVFLHHDNLWCLLWWILLVYHSHNPFIWTQVRLVCGWLGLLGPRCAHAWCRWLVIE